MEEKLSGGRYKVQKILTLKEMLENSAKLYPENAAFYAKSERGGEYQRITFSRLKKDVESMAIAMLELGLKDKKIAIIGENCYQWAVCYLAVVNHVGTVLPLDKELLKEEVENLIVAAKCDAVVFTDSFSDYFSEERFETRILIDQYKDNFNPTRSEETDNIKNYGNLILSGTEKLQNGRPEFMDQDIDHLETRMILYTSGTTGEPKGIMLSHYNILSNIMDTRRIVKIYPDDVSLSILPIHHTFECTLGIMTMLYSGAAVAFCEGLKYIRKNLIEAKPSVLVVVPLILESLYSRIFKEAEKTGRKKILEKAIVINRKLRAAGIHLEKRFFKQIHESFGGRLRLIVCGAVAIDPNVFRGFCEMGFNVVQGYGLTECSPLVAGTPDYTENFKKPGSVGPVVPSGTLTIENPGPDGIGEICFNGPNLMNGYANMPAETSNVMRNGMFHTGDLGFLDKNGWLYITGRLKNVIVTKTGKNIYPEELEGYVNRRPYILESMVYGIDDEDEAEGSTVAVQVRPDEEAIIEGFGKLLDPEEIEKLMKEEIDEVNEKLPIYKRIRHILIRQEEFIKTTTKKIKRQKNIIKRRKA